MLNFKVLICLAFVLGIALAMPSDTNTIPGGVTRLSGSDLNEAKQTLQDSLSKLATGDGPKFRISKLIWATRQTVAGSLYKLYAELIDNNNVTKKCNVTIWSRPWLENGIEVTFECDGENKLVKKHDA